MVSFQLVRSCSFGGVHGDDLFFTGLYQEWLGVTGALEALEVVAAGEVVVVGEVEVDAVAVAAECGVQAEQVLHPLIRYDVA